MKTTIDLPDDLLRQLKLRALNDRRKLKELAADLLRTALAATPVSKKKPQPVILKDKKTGLPVIQCRTTPPKNQQLTPDRVAEILNQQDSEWINGGGGRGAK